MAYSVSTYCGLINAIGEGALADALLSKWLDDDSAEASARWINLADDMYRVKHNTNQARNFERRIKELGSIDTACGGSREHSAVPRWKVVIWYLSMGYQPKEIAVQLRCGHETIKAHLVNARKEMNLVGANQPKLIAIAIREGIIP